MTDTRRVATEIRPPEPPPEALQSGMVVWLRQNLFGSRLDTVITVVVVAVGVLLGRGMLAFLLAPNRKWEVIPRNTANYLVASYPRQDLGRMWFALVMVAVLIGVSLAGWRPRGRVEMTTLVAAVRAVGAVVLVPGLLAPSGGLRNLTLAVGLVLVSATIPVVRRLRRRSDVRELPVVGVVGILAVIALAAVWLINSSRSANVGLTIALALGAASYGVGRRLIRRVREQSYKLTVAVAWLLAIPVIFLQVERNPLFDIGRMMGWLSWVAPILVAGGGVIMVIARLGREAAAAVNALLMVVALGSWAVPMPMVARFQLLVLALLALAIPTFGRAERGRRGMLVAWCSLTGFVFYLFAVGAASPGIATQGEYYGGLNLTFLLSVCSIVLSFPLGILLALGRTSRMPIFRIMSTAYVEVIRGVPLITVLFFFVFFLPNFMPRQMQIAKVVTVLVGITLFSAAYLAENVRGGLQSVAHGQVEAARALGMSTTQMTLLITLPQALRAVIPAIVGQVISLFKDTSLVSIVGLADFFRVAQKIVPNQPNALGSIIENLLLAAMVYWVFTFSFSRASLRLEQRLGVGTR